MRDHDPAFCLRKISDRIAHGYETLHFPIIWQTVKDDIPSLVGLLEPLLTKLDEAGAPDAQ